MHNQIEERQKDREKVDSPEYYMDAFEAFSDIPDIARTLVKEANISLSQKCCIPRSFFHASG